MTRMLICLLIAASLTACATQSQKHASKPAPAAESVAGTAPKKLITYSILEVAEPVEFKMKNDFGVLGVPLQPLLWLVQKGVDGPKGTRLTIEMERRGVKPGAAIREQVAALLNKAGMVELPAPEVTINPAKPYDVNYDKLALPGEVLVHIYFDGIGVRSPGSRTTYQPYIYAAYCLAIPSQGKGCLTGTSAHYGDGNTENSDLIAVADRLENWFNTEDVYAHIDGVADAFKNGAMKLSPLLAKSILSELEAVRATK